jgi:hypothetical protein
VRKRRNELTELEARIQAAVTDLELKRRNLGQAEQARKERHQLKESIRSEEQTVNTARERRDVVRN